jgi:acetoin utilization protein AcuB
MSLIDHYMTPNPHTIGRHVKLVTAHEMMRKYDIRHLPVLDGGHLVGVVSQRDLYLLETFKNVDQNEVAVEEAMTSDPYVVEQGTDVREVARTMASRKLGTAIVVQAGKVVGIFTAVDALRALVTPPRTRGKRTRATPIARDH